LKAGVPVGRRAVVAAPVVRAALAEAGEVEGAEMEERRRLETWVKQQLPGGFAAAGLIGIGRRKTAVARVVLVEGTRKVVINNRTAQVGSPKFLKFELFEKNSFVSEVYVQFQSMVSSNFDM
jgi:hypothetical protein